MKRRASVGLLDVPPVIIPPAIEIGPSEPDGSTLPHECVDRPHLPCPACMKFTGNPFASKDNMPPPRLRKRRGLRLV